MECESNVFYIWIDRLIAYLVGVIAHPLLEIIKGVA
jgi:hypothetical protein